MNEYNPQPGFDGLDWIMCALVLALTFAAELAFDRPVERQPEPQVFIDAAGQAHFGRPGAEPQVEQQSTDEEPR